jgi:hypothetical protein
VVSAASAETTPAEAAAAASAEAPATTPAEVAAAASAEAAETAAVEAAAVECRCRHPRSGAELLRSHEAPLYLTLEPLSLWRVTILRQGPVALRLVLESLNLRFCPILRR